MDQTLLASRVWLGSLVAAGLLLLLPGCDGCRIRRPAPTTERKKPEAPKPDFESKDLRVLPVDESLGLQAVKPGHWFSVQQEIKSNRADFFGEVDCRSGNQAGEASRLRQSYFGLHVRRAVSLPKGQAKTFELTFFAPDPVGEQRVWLHSDLRLPLGGLVRSADISPQPALPLRAYQNHLVVLARRPDSYGYLKTLPSIKPPTDAMYAGGIGSDYLVILARPTGVAPLPSRSLQWTTISYVVWDDFDASGLTADQQQALLDWLQWGGQLLISGPTSLDAMQSGFLANLLPAKPGPMRALEQAEVDALNAQWGLRGRSPWRLNPQLPPQVVTLVLQQGAEFSQGSSQLVAERRVGRGRIAITAFSLSAREFVNWDPGIDNFFNGCLMRRPPRRFSYTDEAGLSAHWESGLEGLPVAPVYEAGDPEADLAPRRLPSETLLTSRLRYFSRDARKIEPREAGRLSPADVGGFGYDRFGGVAGWNDLSDCSLAARKTLTRAAGIDVPDREFVLWTLGLYLLVLVPANWALFRALGRVEWAWLAVPLIALGGTWFVVRMAQLDIGFARSRTEVTVLETQPGYSRAHLTRYTGLYTSLSARYALSFANDTALALPLAIPMDETRRQREPTRTVILRRLDTAQEKVRLEDFLVQSASTGMLHSEEMLDLGGGIQLMQPATGLYRVENKTRHAFRDVGVLRRQEGVVQLGWIGRFDAQQSYRIEFRDVSDDDTWWEVWRDSFQDAAGNVLPLASLELLELAVDPGRLQEGDLRLVGWLDDEVPGLEIHPDSSQQSFCNLLVANLQYGPLPAPASDVNAPQDFKTGGRDDRAD